MIPKGQSGSGCQRTLSKDFDSEWAKLLNAGRFAWVLGVCMHEIWDLRDPQGMNPACSSCQCFSRPVCYLYSETCQSLEVYLATSKQYVKLSPCNYHGLLEALVCNRILGAAVCYTIAIWYGSTYIILHIRHWLTKVEVKGFHWALELGLGGQSNSSFWTWWKLLIMVRLMYKVGVPCLAINVQLLYLPDRSYICVDGRPGTQPFANRPKNDDMS